MSEQVWHHYLMWGWLISAVPIFLLLFFVSAPYGRHFRGTWGPGIGAIAGWVLMEAPAAFIFAVCVLAEGWPTSPVVLVFLVMWQAHYVQRAFIYPLLIRSKKQMALLVILMALCFNTVNGYINGRWVGAFSPGWDVSWFWDPRFIIGVALWICGYAINIHSDHILRHLRKPGDTEYRIPEGGMYRWVSCPNYLGEIVEWTGWAIATWSLAGLTFAIWTFANLVPRARTHHRWYVSTFEDYPRNRKAVIPYLL